MITYFDELHIMIDYI